MIALSRFPEASDYLQRALQIRKELSQRAPSDPSFLEELALAYSAVGDLHIAQKNWAEALVQYMQCRAILEQLATKDTPNLSWRRMLAQCTQTVADLLMAEDKPGDALGIYRQSLEIRRALFNQDKMNAVWQRDLGTTLYLTSVCLKKLGGDDNLTQARDYLQEALSIADDYHGADQAQVLDVLKKALDGVSAIPTPKAP